MSRIDHLYERFERRFRGDRSAICERLSQYAPLLDILEKRQPEGRAIDCGCGRGEWLELLARRGWSAQGVDTNANMVREAAIHGVDVVHADVLAHLSKQADGSVALVSAFHMVEHLPTEMLLMMLSEMNRVICKGGLILLETPNPENLTVGTSSFYLDPTHRNPLPPELLRFFLEQCGSEHAVVMRLNGERDAEAIESVEQAIRPMFYRALDYAAIGLRSDDESLLADVNRFVASIDQGSPVDLTAVKKLDETIARDRAGAQQAADSLHRSVFEARDALHVAVEAVYNTTLPLSDRLADVQRNLEAVVGSTLPVAERLGTLEHDVATALNGIASVLAQIDKSAKLTQMSMREELAAMRRTFDARELRHVHAIETLRKALDETATRTSNSPIEALMTESVRRIAQADAEASVRTANIYLASTSWRITAPLRAAGALIRRRSSAVLADGTTRHPSTAPTTPPGSGILANPHVWRMGRWIVRRVPGMRARLLRSMDRNNLLTHPLSDPAMEVASPVIAVPAVLFRYIDDVDDDTRAQRMPGEAARIYRRLIEIQEASQVSAR